MYQLLLIIFIFYNAILPIFHEFNNKKDKDYLNKLSEVNLMDFSRRAIKFGVISTIIILIISRLIGISFYDLGLRWITFYTNRWLLVPTLVVGSIYIFAYILTIIFNLYHNETKNENKLNYEKMSGIAKKLLPTTQKEKFYWFLVSLVAGIGEEIRFRGFLMYLLITLFPTFSTLVTVLIQAVIFGVAHAYQGKKGIIKTGIWGFVFGILFVATGSLVPSMLLHFLVDIENVTIIKEGKA